MSPHQNTIGYRWRTTLLRAGVADVRLHDLRHFYPAGLIASGCDVFAVQLHLGHSRSTTTLTTYAPVAANAADLRKRADSEVEAELERRFQSLLINSRKWPLTCEDAHLTFRSATVACVYFGLGEGRLRAETAP